MTETNKLKDTNQAPTQPKKVEPIILGELKGQKWKPNLNLDNLEKNLITLTGITTSQINQALKANSPYPARVFLKVDNQEQDIPIFFRIKERKDCPFHSSCSEDCRYKSWIRPKIKTGSYLEVEGYFDNPTNKNQRKSFTATSYQFPNSQLNQEIEINHGRK